MHKIELESDSSLYTHCLKPLGRHTLFAADFGSPDRRESDPCPQAFARRRKGRTFNRVELAEQEAIQVQLRTLAEAFPLDAGPSVQGRNL